MKKMTAETFATLSVIILCWVVLIVADAAICGLLKSFVGLPFRKAFLWGLISLAVPPLVIIYGALIERNLFKVKKVEIVCEGLPDGFDGFRIMHISDIHARSFEGREKHLQKAVDLVNGQEADLVAFTGDLISMDPDELEGISSILSEIRAKDGILSVLGNHDYCLYSDMDEQGKAEALEKLISEEASMGWTLLLNENRIIRRGNDSIAVIGVENTSPSRHFPSRGNLAKASSGTDGMFRILLSHDPLHWEYEILGKDYPLTLSGHTHAMQFSLFGWCPSQYMFPQYRGLYHSKGQQLHVNPGLGETIFPARIGVRPEITLITLHLRPEIK